MDVESMTQATLFVCSLCRFSAAEPSREDVSGGQQLIHQLQAELETRNLEEAIHLQPVRCMAACSQPCNVTLAAPDKLTFILSGLPPTDSVSPLLEFCQQYTDCPGGKIPYRERSSTIHDATAFILPPLPTSYSHD